MNINKDNIEILKNDNDNFIQNELIPFLKIPSYTLNKEGINDAKDFIKSYIMDFCEDISQFEGQINPFIFAKVKGKIDTPLLIYMMYDTQPINEYNRWISPPFNANIRNLPSLENIGECIIARGAYNSKTPLLAFLNVVRILKSMDMLPISLYLIFDGEEEMGSPTFSKILEENKNLFKSCIDAYYPSIKQDLSGKAVLKLGYKGLLSLTIKTISNNQEVHSSYSNIVPKPSLDLLEVIQGIYSNNHFQITPLSKVYDLSDQEIVLINSLANKENINDILNKAGINQITADNPYNLFKNYLFDPTFNLSTFKSGYLKEGIKNSVPNLASCNIDIRFAHQLSSKAIFDVIKNKISELSKNIRSKVDIKINNGYESSRIDSKSRLVKSLIKTFEILNIKTEIWPISAAAAPLSKIQKELGINYITAGLGIGGNAHCANEFVQVKSIINTRLSYYYFLETYSNFISKNN